MTMKKIVNSFAALMVLTSASVSAQTPWTHIYSDDETEFVSLPMEKVKSTSFTPMGGNFSEIVVKSVDGDMKLSLDNLKKWIIGANVATIRITTDEEGISDISDKTTKYPSTIIVDGAGLYDDIDGLPITFRGRGNSTLNYPKKAYNIKFENKTRICDFKKAKSYVLLANWIDGSFMRNYAAFSFARLIGMPYANSCRPVDVYLNGVYKGTYILTQKVGFNNGSVDLPKEDEANSVMIEIDTCDPAAGLTMEYGGFTPQLRIPYQLKDPDAPEDPTEAKEWWYEWAREFEDLEEAVVSGSDLSKLIDYKTLAKYIMANNLACNQELNHPKSVMLWKTKGGKWQFGPCWDFDWAFGYNQTYVGYDSGSNNKEARKAHYEELVAQCKVKYGETISTFYDTDGTLLWWIDLVPGKFDVYMRSAEGYIVQYLEGESLIPLPSYQSPLLATGKNYQSGKFGGGGEFFLYIIKNNQEFLDEYARLWAEVEPKIKDYLKDFDAFVEELEPSAYRELTASGWGSHHTLGFNESVKSLKSWIKNRIEFIGKPENNYGLY